MTLIASREVNSYRFGFCASTLSNKTFETPLQVNARRGSIDTSHQNGFQTELKALELALVRLKENGSAEEGYQSVSEEKEIDCPFYVAARDDSSFLVSNIVEPDGTLIHPARMRFQDVIRYETLRRL